VEIRTLFSKSTFDSEVRTNYRYTYHTRDNAPSLATHTQV